MSESAIYEGHIRHRRFAVRNHQFRYRLAMAYIDLDELPTLLGGRLTRSRPTRTSWLRWPRSCGPSAQPSLSGG